VDYARAEMRTLVNCGLVFYAILGDFWGRVCPMGLERGGKEDGLVRNWGLEGNGVERGKEGCWVRVGFWLDVLESGAYAYA
jgi:hypothetical protein